MFQAARAATMVAVALLAPTVVVGCGAGTPGQTAKAPVIVVGEASKRVAAAKPETKVDEKKQALDKALEYGILGALNGSGAEGTLDLNPSLGVLGGDSIGRLGGISGVIGGPGSTFGTGGLGLSGVGLGGGGSGEGIGIGSIGTLQGYGSGSLSGDRVQARLDKVTIEGPLLADVVQRILGDHQTDVQDCYRLEHARSAWARGRLTLVFKIDAKGQVNAVMIPEATLTSRDMLACVAQVIGALEFPPPNPSADVLVTLPITF